MLDDVLDVGVRPLQCSALAKLIHDGAQLITGGRRSRSMSVYARGMTAFAMAGVEDPTPRGIRRLRVSRVRKDEDGAKQHRGSVRSFHPLGESIVFKSL